MAVRILVDTNIWRAVADTRLGETLARHAKKNDISILIAPSVVYETLATKDRALRDAILRLQTMPAWRRLMPEAYSECEEIRLEVLRLHPEWFSEQPDLKLYERLRRDWARTQSLGKKWDAAGFWNRVRFRSEEMARATHNPLLDVAREESKEIGDWTKLNSKAVQSLKGVTMALAGQPRSAAVDAWRWPALTAFANHVHRPHGPYRDWLDPFFKLKPAEMGADPWTMFWIYEADTLALPRQWIRWAFSHLQSHAKWSSGTPCDAQLASYLLECDHVVSADKQFVRIANELKSQAPFSMPVAHLMAGGHQGAMDLIELCTSVGTGEAAMIR